jgi:hypothetical protein
MPESEEGHIASSERLTGWQLTGSIPLHHCPSSCLFCPAHTSCTGLQCAACWGPGGEWTRYLHLAR